MRLKRSMDLLGCYNYRELLEVPNEVLSIIKICQVEEWYQLFLTTRRGEFVWDLAKVQESTKEMFETSLDDWQQVQIVYNGLQLLVGPSTQRLQKKLWS